MFYDDCNDKEEILESKDIGESNDSKETEDFEDIGENEDSIKSKEAEESMDTKETVDGEKPIWKSFLKRNLSTIIITVLVIITTISAGFISYMITEASKIKDTEEEIEEVKEENKEDEKLKEEDTKDVSADEDSKTDKANSGNEYLYPSDKELLTDEDLSKLSRDEIGYIRNEIYAKKGYVFTQEPYKTYFSEKSWYTPNESFDESSITEIEKENINTILNYERRMGWR